jgi:hypothetical protein
MRPGTRASHERHRSPQAASDLEVFYVVEAGRIELPSEETNDREHSCFSQVHLCLVIDA